MGGGEAGASTEPSASPPPWPPSSAASGAPGWPQAPGHAPPRAGWLDRSAELRRLEADRRRRRSTARIVGGLLALAVVALLVAVVAVVAVAPPTALEQQWAASDPRVSRGSLPPGWTPDDGGGRTRLGPEPSPTGIGGEHAYVWTEDDGDPVAWDPCEPIRYVVNDRSAPPGAEAILDRAIAEVEGATGLVFEMVGRTDEEPPLGETSRRQQDEERYGGDWSPVLIAWTDVDTDPSLDGYAGVASALAMTYRADGEAVYVTGMVRLLGDYATAMIEAGDTDAIVSVAMHELGHLVGLDHVGDRNEVMNDQGDALPTTWGPGDRSGLAALGRGDCVPQV